MDHLERMFVWRQKALVVAPTLDEGEPARLARRVGQRVDDILQ